VKKLLVILALCMVGQTAHGEKVVSLQQKDLTDIPGKEGLMVIVEIAPGESVPKHRHKSDVFVYVLSGTIVTQAQGEPARRRDVF
jgi:quercetin dioxygenase-like cupin family protein